MAALPENDRIAGPFIATAGQTDFPADFPLLDSVGLRARIVRETGSIDLEDPAIVAVASSDAGFTARMAAPCFVGDRVWIYSALPAARSRAHTPNGAVRTRTLEDDAEGMQAQLQELRRDLGRTVRVDIGQPLPSPGDIIDAAEATSRIRTKLEKASLAVMPEAAQEQVFVANREAPGDGYGGVFEWVPGDQSASVAADPEQGVWVAPAIMPSGALGAWKRLIADPINPVWFGGRTSAALQAAINYARELKRRATVEALGEFEMTATVRYEGGQQDGIIFDGDGAIFRRASDYGPTFYVSGKSDGEPLERCIWLFGRLEDTNDSMTVANSRRHVVFDNVNFLEWSIAEIVGGCGGAALLGCATTKAIDVQSWRFQGGYKGAGSIAMYVGRSEIPASANVYGGDHHGLGGLDLYCGRGKLSGLTGGTGGASATVAVNSIAGIEVGGLIAEPGLNGNNQYARIPKGTTVTAVNAGAGTITLSAAVNLPANAPLVVFYPALEYGLLIAACDGLWADNDMIHSMFAQAASFKIKAEIGQPLWNIRLRIMPDWAPGNSLEISGTGEVRDGVIELHHPYNGRHSIVDTAAKVNFSVLSQDQKWSRDGFDYGGAVSAAQLEIKGAGGYTELLFKENGVTRYDLNSSAGVMALQARNAAGVNLGNVWEIDQPGKLLSVKWPLQHSACEVADLASAPFTGYYDGTEVLCYNCRVLTAGGALQGPGAGTGGKIWKLAGKWYVVGTNVEAQA